jgi:hypothetical protein
MTASNTARIDPNLVGHCCTTQCDKNGTILIKMGWATFWAISGHPVGLTCLAEADVTAGRVRLLTDAAIFARPVGAGLAFGDALGTT